MSEYWDNIMKILDIAPALIIIKVVASVVLLCAVIVFVIYQ